MRWKWRAEKRMVGEEKHKKIKISISQLKQQVLSPQTGLCARTMLCRAYTIISLLQCKPGAYQVCLR